MGQAPGQLIARLGSVAAGGDRVAQYLYLRAAAPIVSAAAGTPWAAELTNALRALDESANGKARAKAVNAQAQATELRRQAGELSFFASSTLADLDGSQKASDQARLSSYQGLF